LLDKCHWNVLYTVHVTAFSLLHRTPDTVYVVSKCYFLYFYYFRIKSENETVTKTQPKRSSRTTLCHFQYFQTIFRVSVITNRQTDRRTTT